MERLLEESGVAECWGCLLRLRVFRIKPDDPSLFPELIRVFKNALLPDAPAQLKFQEIHNRMWFDRYLMNSVVVLLLLGLS